MSLPRPTALIAEDEPLLRAELVELLGSLWPELAIVAQAATGFDAVRMLDEHRPSIVFLDIQMPGLSGLEVARKAGDRAHVVFVTAYDEYALAAFEEGAVDYLVKPIVASRVARAVQRLKARVAAPPADLARLLDALARTPAEPPSYLRWVNASVGTTIRLIDVEEVCYFKADLKYTVAVTATGESMLRKPIRELAEALDPRLFWQIHRSTLVNVKAVAGVTRDLRGRLRVKLKQRPEVLPVAESCVHLFRPT
jgi:DNA-binding LytR/AlgR family response regulator